MVRVLHANQLPPVVLSGETFPGLDALIDPQLLTPPVVGVNARRVNPWFMLKPCVVDGRRTSVTRAMLAASLLVF